MSYFEQVLQFVAERQRKETCEDLRQSKWIKSI